LPGKVLTHLTLSWAKTPVAAFLAKNPAKTARIIAAVRAAWRKTQPE
jgi:hypothetical protein